jgi:hypothetical protein
MSRILLDVEAPPATPAAGRGVFFAETGGKRATYKDDSGRTHTLSGRILNYNTADVVANAADTYLTGSNLVVPTGMVLQVGTMFRWTLYMTKTAAGVAAPIWAVHVGTAGTVADAARVTFTQVALQTAVIDTGVVEITAILRNVGAAGVLAGGLAMTHVLAATGFSTLTDNVMQVTSAGFDTTIAGTIIGVSVNPGAAGVWTHQVVKSEMLNI